MNEIEKAREEYRKEKIERARQLLREGKQLRRSGKDWPCYNCGSRTTLYLIDDKEEFGSGNELISLCRTCSEILNPHKSLQQSQKQRKVPIRMGETYDHYVIKQAIAQICKEEGYTSQIEASGQGYRADVYAEKEQTRLAFEVQLSPQTLEQTIERQKRYQQQGILGCWLFGKPPFSRGTKLPIFRLITSPDFSVHIQNRNISLNQFVQDFLSGKIRFHSKTILEDRTFKFLNPQPVNVIFIDFECWKCKEPGHIYYVNCCCISEDGEIMNDEDKQRFQGERLRKNLGRK